MHCRWHYLDVHRGLADTLSNAARILPPIVGWCLPAMFTWVFTTWRVWRLISC
jgi:hypothetical protein